MGGAQISNASITAPLYRLTGKTVIYAETTAVGGPTTAPIYTVTAGKNFYLIGCGLNIYATTTNLYCKVVKNAGARPLIWDKSSVDATTTIYSNTTIIAYPHPLPFVGGDIFDVYASSNGITGFAWIQGWEE